MRYRMFLRAAVALLVLVVILLVVGPVFAQTVTPPAPAADTSILGSIVAAVLAALPGLALGGWALFKAYAAKSAAMWDDEAVAFVEKLAKGVVDSSAAASAGKPATTAPVTGVDH